MVPAWLSRLVRVFAPNNSIQEQLKDLSGLIKKNEAARRDALRATDRAFEELRGDVHKLSKQLEKVTTHLTDLDAKRHAAIRREQTRITATADQTRKMAADLPGLMTKAADLEQRTGLLEQWAAGSDELVPALRDSLSAVQDLTSAKAHARQAVANATLETDPSAHVVIDDVLPSAFYDLLLATIPPPASFEPIDHTKADFRPFGGPPAPIASRLVWQAFDREIVDGTLREALLTLFEPVITAHYARIVGRDLAEVAAALPTTARGRLMRRLPGYRLHPHLDPKRVLITGILYFARPGDSEEYGTSLYRVNRPFVAPFLKTYYPQEDGLQCELAKTVTFRRNRLFAFINADAAHATEIPETSTQRDRYAFQFYLKPASAGLRRIVEMLPQDRQAQWAGAV